jgi:hypothetical protein
MITNGVQIDQSLELVPTNMPIEMLVVEKTKEREPISEP